MTDKIKINPSEKIYLNILKDNDKVELRIDSIEGIELAQTLVNKYFDNLRNKIYVIERENEPKTNSKESVYKKEK